MGLGASDVPDFDSALQTMIGDATACSGAQNANVQNVQTEYNAAFPGSAIPVSSVLDQVTLNAINGYLGLIQASYTLSCTGSTGAVVQGPAPITPATPTPWGTYALVGGSVLALGALAMAWRKQHAAAPLRRFNPAHEDFIGRRVELHPGHDLWMRGARYGTVRKVEGDTLVIKMDHSAVKKLVRVRKDRVTLI